MSYSISQFPITDGQIDKFENLVKKPRDCVINALQLVGVFDSRTANIARILIGDIGVTKPQLEDLLSLVKPKFQWNFYQYSKIETLVQKTNSFLQPNNAIICGFEGHVFIIAKDNFEGIYHIDPQRTGKEICKLSPDENNSLDTQCLEYISNKNSYYILQYRIRKTEVEDLSDFLDNVKITNKKETRRNSQSGDDIYKRTKRRQN